jgi:hypothetical protein
MELESFLAAVSADSLAGEGMLFSRSITIGPV